MRYNLEQVTGHYMPAFPICKPERCVNVCNELKIQGVQTTAMVNLPSLQYWLQYKSTQRKHERTSLLRPSFPTLFTEVIHVRGRCNLASFCSLRVYTYMNMNEWMSSYLSEASWNYMALVLVFQHVGNRFMCVGSRMQKSLGGGGGKVHGLSRSWFNPHISYLIQNISNGPKDY